MKSVVLICVYLAGYTYGADNINGVGAFAYNGPEGRYGGTYGLKDGEVVEKQGTFPPNFSPPTYQNFDDFFPDYFSNLDNLLQEAAFIPPPFFYPHFPFGVYPGHTPFFRTFDNVDDQRLAFAAATKAFDITSNRAGSNQYIPAFRYPYQGNFPGFNFGAPGFPGQGFPGFDMSNFRNGDSAYAGAAIGPDYTQQEARISPENPNNPNVNKFSSVGSGPGGRHSVSTSSFVSTSNINGKKSSVRKAETIVDNNGVITKYKVES